MRGIAQGAAGASELDSAPVRPSEDETWIEGAETSRRGEELGETLDDNSELSTLSRIGRYVLSARVGVGASGVVFSAWDPELERQVALKFIDVARGDSLGRQRVLREAQALARLEHPNVVAIHDVGEERGRLYLVMSLIKGMTLSKWLKAEPRSQAEILAVFVQAGRGLAAAHAAGLVHRDFKPGNVMIDEQGQALVVDFGLARASQGGGVTTPGTGVPRAIDRALEHSGTLDTSLTREGTLVGTPAFMALELFAGCPADARSDQFAFAVSLYRALYGERPYGGKSVPSIVVAMREERLRPPPRWSPVRSVLVRALAVDATARWPDMDTVVELLLRDRGAQRRGVLLGLLGLSALCALLAGGQWTEAPPVCTGAEAELAPVWNLERRAELEAVFEGVDSSWGAVTGAQVLAGLDDYARAWVAEHRGACEATRVRREQSEEVLDQRMRCLAHGRRELGVLVEVLGAGERARIERAVPGVAGLPDPAACGELDELARSELRPADPTLAARIDRVAETLDRVQVLQRTGDYEAGLARLEELGPELEGLSHAPTQASFVHAGGSLRAAVGDYEDAAAELERSFHLALGAELRPRAAAIARELAFVVGERQAQHALGHHWLRLAESLGASELDTTMARASLTYREGDYEAALVEYRRGIEAFESSERTGPELAALYNGEGLCLLRLAHTDEARVPLGRAVAIMDEELGPGHPKVASTLINLASVEAQAGELERARDTYARVQVVLEREFGPTHPNLGVVFVNLSGILRRLGELDEAHALGERAVAIYTERFGAEHPKLSIALAVLSRVELERGELDAAQTHAERALEIMAARHDPEHIKRARPTLGLARVHMAKGEHERALALLEQARVQIGDNPLVADIVCERERSLRRLGRPTGDAEDIRVSVELCEGQVDCGAFDHAELLLAQARLLEAGGGEGDPVALRERGRELLAEASGALADELRAALAESPEPPPG